MYCRSTVRTALGFFSLVIVFECDKVHVWRTREVPLPSRQWPVFKTAKKKRFFFHRWHTHARTHTHSYAHIRERYRTSRFREWWYRIVYTPGVVFNRWWFKRRKPTLKHTIIPNTYPGAYGLNLSHKTIVFNSEVLFFLFFSNLNIIIRKSRVICGRTHRVNRYCLLFLIQYAMT